MNEWIVYTDGSIKSMLKQLNTKNNPGGWAFVEVHGNCCYGPVLPKEVGTNSIGIKEVDTYATELQAVYEELHRFIYQLEHTSWDINGGKIVVICPFPAWVRVPSSS